MFGGKYGLQRSVGRFKNIQIIRKCLVVSGKGIPLKCFYLSTQEEKEFCKGLASLPCAGVNDCSWSSAGQCWDTLHTGSSTERQRLNRWVIKSKASPCASQIATQKVTAITRAFALKLPSLIQRPGSGCLWTITWSMDREQREKGKVPISNAILLLWPVTF